MISYLEGNIIEINNDSITLKTNGVGYLVYSGTNDINTYKEGDNIQLFIRTIVRENDISLYGFTNKESRNIFDNLITVKGVGPKAAMNILGNISALSLAEAIINEDSSVLKKVKGLGAKTSDTIIFSLKDKLKKEYTCIAKNNNDTLNKGIDDVIQSLIVLGYPKALAEKIVNTIYNEDISVQENIKNCLKAIRKG